MKILTKFLLFLLLITVTTACQQEEEVAKLSEMSLIPLPVSLEDGEGNFKLKDGMTISINQEDEGLSQVASFLANRLSPATGFNFETKVNAEAENGIILKLEDNTDWSDEEYQLEVTAEKVTITANMPQGIFRGVQTLIQALPPAIENTEKVKASWKIPCGKIQDKPSYGHRGAMLDVSRHFFGMDDVKRYIDFIAAYKMNILHLHLTDDQGWRIEIKSYPNLTTHGGSTEVGGGEGGFFTQDQYTEIVNYAAERFITVIPEIDMPGHTNAATASYGELRCDNKATELYTGIEVGFSTLCVRKQETWNFVDSVIRELAAITPGPYIHIGGDESHSTKKPDYVYFVNKAQEIVNKYGKQMIGWDEVATADFKPNSIAQYWAKAENAKLAVEKGGKLIMSPARKAYMDMQYDSTTRIGLHWAAYIEVDSGYIWDLETIEDGIPRENIMGIETPLWSETTENMADIEYLVFPRFLGYSEIGWTPTAQRSWEEYKVRLGKHKARLDAKNIGFYPSKFVDWK